MPDLPRGPGPADHPVESADRAGTRRYASSRPSTEYPEPPLGGELSIDYPPGTRWAAVLTHDIDHLGIRDHFVDAYLFRYAASICRQDLLGRFRPLRAANGLWGIVLAALGRDRWASVSALLDTDRRAGVRSTWFIAVRRGLGIRYDLGAVRRTVALLRESGCDVGLHGQTQDNAAAFAAEAGELASITGAPVTGARMHYLRLTSAVLDGLARAGLRYDSTVYERTRLHPDEHPLAGPRMVRPGLLEIPLHVMDSTLFSATGMGLDAAGARDYCRRLADHAAERGRVLVVDAHSNTYSAQSPDIRRWYDALVADLTSRSDVFLTDFAGLLPRIRTS